MMAGKRERTDLSKSRKTVGNFDSESRQFAHKSFVFCQSHVGDSRATQICTMSKSMNFGEITAIANRHLHGSEVLLFKRNEGLLGRIVLPEKGDLLEKRLLRSMKRILES